MLDHYNRAEFPKDLIPKVRELGINGLGIKGFGSPELSTIEAGAMLFEISKIDLSVASFVVVHNSIGMSVIDLVGSDEQK